MNAADTHNLIQSFRDISHHLCSNPSVVADYEKQLEQAKLQLADAKKALENAEALAADDALSQEGLSSEVKRKAAIAKAIAEDPHCKECAESVRAFSGLARMAEISLNEVVSEGKHLARRLDAMRTEGEIRAAQIAYETSCNYVRAVELKFKGNAHV